MSILALLGLIVIGRQGPGTPTEWTVAPGAGPATVGDTVWLERRFTLPGGWRVRPGRLASADEVEALADPVVLREGADWVVRYPVAAWSPGLHTVTLPPVWRLAPDSRADSVPGGSATFVLASVIPDSVTKPVPRPALAPLRDDARDVRFPLMALLLAGASLGGAIWWRRRPARAAAGRAPGPHARTAASASPDRRWLDAGESKAVAARAAGRLRVAIARGVPEAHLGLSTGDCLAVVQARRPQAPLSELQTVLGALDQAAYAAKPPAGMDVVALARVADTLAERLGR